MGAAIVTRLGVEEPTIEAISTLGDDRRRNRMFRLPVLDVVALGFLSHSILILGI